MPHNDPADNRPTSDTPSERRSPINQAKAERGPEPGMALALSGGGYRAMLFHLGTLWRLYDAGLLKELQRISSVSGGSITAGQLALQWHKLSFVPGNLRQDFEPLVVNPIRALARHTLDVKSVLAGIFLPGTIGEKIAKAYRKHLYGDATLQSLPDTPRFVINATNVQSGVLWRFSKPFMGDYRVGLIEKPTLSLATAIAASSAFPPILSPLVIEVDPASFGPPEPGVDLNHPPFNRRIVLSDGGVYDNLGLETIWKRYQTILVSDAGAKIADEGKPSEDWAFHSLRVLDLIDNQVRSLRKRQLIGSYVDGLRTGAYWSIRGDITHYGGSAEEYPPARTLELAATPTRLEAMPDERQERLINWGYAIADASLRKNFMPELPSGALPYPKRKV
ncbi:patatin-like phospholipase family protein [Dongia sp.]|uniref:patatin-like phospholipase family protein n=1 Tax=Dongia sp. TaxID=1977262 RepID=UPI0035AEC49C